MEGAREERSPLMDYASGGEEITKAHKYAMIIGVVAIVILFVLWHRCMSYGIWQTSDWGDCSAQCGGGTQTRTVTCSKNSCNPAMPMSSQACNTAACPAPSPS